LLDASAAVLRAKKGLQKSLYTTLYASDSLSRRDGDVIDHLP